MAVEVSAGEGALRAGAAAVAQARTELKGQTDALDGKLSGIGSSWKGEGAIAFQSLMARWREDAQKLTAALDTFEANLRASDQTYVSADEAQKSSMANLTAMLG